MGSRISLLKLYLSKSKFLSEGFTHESKTKATRAFLLSQLGLLAWEEVLYETAKNDGT